MATKKQKLDLTDEIRAALRQELDTLSNHAELADRMAIIDRAIKFEAMRRKGGDDEYGSAFNDEEEG
jgi:hypothetical protein